MVESPFKFYSAPKIGVDQSDIIRAMASYMNEQGESIDWFSLGIIAVGMLLIILTLRLIGHAAKRKQEKAHQAKLKALQKAREQERKAHPTQFHSLHRRKPKS